MPAFLAEKFEKPARRPRTPVEGWAGGSAAEDLPWFVNSDLVDSVDAEATAAPAAEPGEALHPRVRHATALLLRLASGEPSPKGLSEDQFVRLLQAATKATVAGATEAEIMRHVTQAWEEARDSAGQGTIGWVACASALFQFAKLHGHGGSNDAHAGFLETVLARVAVFSPGAEVPAWRPYADIAPPGALERRSPATQRAGARRHRAFVAPSAAKAAKPEPERKPEQAVAPEQQPQAQAEESEEAKAQALERAVAAATGAAVKTVQLEQRHDPAKEARAFLRSRAARGMSPAERAAYLAARTGAGAQLTPDCVRAGRHHRPPRATLGPPKEKPEYQHRLPPALQRPVVKPRDAPRPATATSVSATPQRRPGTTTGAFRPFRPPPVPRPTTSEGQLQRAASAPALALDLQAEPGFLTFTGDRAVLSDKQRRQQEAWREAQERAKQRGAEERRAKNEKAASETLAKSRFHARKVGRGRSSPSPGASQETTSVHEESTTTTLGGWALEESQSRVLVSQTLSELRAAPNDAPRTRFAEGVAAANAMRDARSRMRASWTDGKIDPAAANLEFQTYADKTAAAGLLAVPRYGLPMEMHVRSAARGADVNAPRKHARAVMREEVAHAAEAIRMETEEGRRRVAAARAAAERANLAYASTTEVTKTEVTLQMPERDLAREHRQFGHLGRGRRGLGAAPKDASGEQEEQDEAPPEIEPPPPEFFLRCPLCFETATLWCGECTAGFCADCWVVKHPPSGAAAAEPPPSRPLDTTLSSASLSSATADLALRQTTSWVELEQSLASLEDPQQQQQSPATSPTSSSLASSSTASASASAAATEAQVMRRARKPLQMRQSLQSILSDGRLYESPADKRVRRVRGRRRALDDDLAASFVEQNSAPYERVRSDPGTRRAAAAAALKGLEATGKVRLGRARVMPPGGRPEVNARKLGRIATKVRQSKESRERARKLAKAKAVAEEARLAKLPRHKTLVERREEARLRRMGGVDIRRR